MPNPNVPHDPPENVGGPAGSKSDHHPCWHKTGTIVTGGDEVICCWCGVKSVMITTLKHIPGHGIYGPSKTVTSTTEVQHLPKAKV